ncbi:peptidase M15 [Janthinobacterium sp. HH103]|uniref:D-Ala-D-Ala carboxypeptidase family metallohydrolase n=1 Tax=unclassified Janthinobacterium TaxID=2610881 RepID=UPI00087424C4|nr:MULTISPECIES: D-Ala-D-Ala carboxypeptidase family metallohydrolase [unclassified Janthinobacterium]OEZ68179.1 peptidase M15 [Janthinobacterium sp. HH100]OEZ87425.1 peptidase M15 [Janthinobacterium sp. HH103]QOU72945.1 Peptidase M15 [Janthinobacterium sp. HH102]
MNLSPHFGLAELVASQVATRQGIDNAPAPAIVANLTRLAALLEQVRALVGAPIAISSGYRSPALNKAVGGAASSAHVLGLAADISTAKLAPKALALLIRQSDIAFDQLIYEGTWVHIALSASAPRRQVLTAKFAGGGVSYVAGIV